MSVDERLAILERDVQNGFDRVEDHFEEAKAELAEIKAEVKKTNGRVTLIELQNAEQKGMIGAFRVIALIPTVAGAVLAVILAVRELT